MYYVYYGGESRGPYMLDQIRTMWGTGIITADAVYWNDQTSAWEPIVDLIQPQRKVVTKEFNEEPLRAVSMGATKEIRQEIRSTAPAAVELNEQSAAKLEGAVRHDFAVKRGVWGVGLPVALVGLFVELVSYHENLWSFLGFAVVLIPGSLWGGYRIGLRQFDALVRAQKTVKPAKVSGCSVAFLLTLWIPVIVSLALYYFSKSREADSGAAPRMADAVPSQAAASTHPPEPGPTAPATPRPSEPATAPEVAAGNVFLGSGSGFFVTGDGYVATNAHVVKEGREFRLKTSAGTIAAHEVRRDTTNDLAVLKAEGHFIPFPIISSDLVKLGSTVATVGFPDPDLQGVSPKYNKGEISSLKGFRDDPSYFQISVPVQPGNSGGALLDEFGNVVGIVSAKLSANAALVRSGALPENVNYAVKSTFLTNLLAGVSGLGVDHLPKPSTTKVMTEELEKSAVLILVYGQAPQPPPTPPQAAAAPPAPVAPVMPGPARVPPTAGPSIPAENKILFAANMRAGGGSLTVENETNQNVVVKMLDVSFGRGKVCSFFVRAGTRFELEHIPNGDYQLIGCFGNGAFATNDTFANPTRAAVLTEKMPYRNFSDFIVTLHPSPQAEQEELPIEINQFDRL